VCRYDDLTENALNGGVENFLSGTSQLCQLADSYVASAVREAGSLAELAASKKINTYTRLAADYHFYPIAVEMLGCINKSAFHFLTVLLVENQC